MRSRFWALVGAQLIVMLATILILGLLSGNWAASIVVPTLATIIWQLVQLYLLESWLSEGAKTQKMPEFSGVWEAISMRIIQRNKAELKQKKRLTGMVKGYRDAVLALPDATVVLNRDLEIEWHNQRASQLLGINQATDIGLQITTLIRKPKFVRQLSKDKSTKSFEMESPVNAGTILSIRVVRYGRNQHLLIARDISASIRAKKAMQSFVSNASHELRTPLTVTSGYIDFLKDSEDLPEPLSMPIKQMREQTDRMAQLINDLLTLSQLEGDSLQPEEGEKIDVPKQIEQFIFNLKQSGTSKTHHFELELDQTLGLRGIDREIGSIISNLIENAIKYTPEGTTVLLRWRISEFDQPCLQVSDDGPGFDPKHIPQLAKRFYRISDNGYRDGVEGTGLGLAIVKHAVLRHGGHLDIKANVGDGAEFGVYFPAYRQLSI